MKILGKLILVGSILFSGFSFAGSGKAIVPHWGAQSGKASYIFLSNITDHDVIVSITYYGKNGAKLSPSTYTNFTNSNTQLSARSSGYVSIQPGAWDYGFATIEWINLLDEDDTVALIAHGFRVVTATTSTRSDFSVQINNGLPF